MADQGTPSITVRPYEPRDLAKVKTLDARVDPYRREDAAEVEAMLARAAAALRPVDRWGVRHSVEFETVLSQGFLECWVAVTGGDEYEVKGVIAVQPFLDGPEVGDLAAAMSWLGSDGVAELTHLRVAEEVRRRGVGTDLVRGVIDWSREHGFRLLVLNTSTPQFPARRLYERLGFREAGIAYLDAKYEVMWYEMAL